MGTTLTLTNVPSSAAYTQNTPGVTLAPSLSVSDPNSATLANATVAITGGAFAGDELAADTGGTNITASYDSKTETLTLTGSDTLAHYQQVLESVTFDASTSRNPTDYGSDPTRAVTWTVNDGGASNNIGTASETIDITSINQPPDLFPVTRTANYTQGGGSVTLSSTVLLSDPDSLDLVSATVSIAGGTFTGDGDVLAAAGQTSGTIVQNGNTITVAYNSTSETLTLTGSDTLADYQTVLEEVTFNSTSANATDDGADRTRTVTWVANDGGGTAHGGTQVSSPATDTISIAAVYQPPTLSDVATSVTYSTGTTITLSGSVSVSDPNDVALTGATVSISGSTFAGDGDVLAVNGLTSGRIVQEENGNTITLAYNAASETLTLTGSDTLADYQQLLEALTFDSTSANPSSSGADPTRTVTWVLNNGGISNNLSTPQTTTIDLVHDAPTLVNVAPSVSFIAGQGAVTLAGNALVSDPDSLDLVGATVSITGGTFTGDGDMLAADGQTSGTIIQNGNTITVAYNATSETLTLTGSDTLADYQTVLDEVTFNNTSANPTDRGSDPTRIVTWTVNDGSATNNIDTATTTIGIQDAVPFDFDGDGISDLVFQDEGSGAGPNAGTPQIWLWNGTGVTSETTLTDPGSNWQVVAAGDFNHDNHADIVLQNTDGLPEIWFMNGTSVTSTATLPDPGPSWHVIATGDFNADGNPDILLQNTDGLPAMWELNGTSVVAAAVLPDPGPSWRAIGTGDFNGDGKSDILWQNADGLPVIWEMNGTSIIGSGELPDPGPSWHIIGAGDFNGDGRSDILLQNTDGLPAIWEMNGTSIVAAALLPNPGTSWHAIGTGEFLGNGTFDIVWQNTDGLPAIWMMNGFSITAGDVLANPGQSWQLQDDGPIPSNRMGAAGLTVPASNGSNGNASLYVSAPDTASPVLHLSAPDTKNPLFAGS